MTQQTAANVTSGIAMGITYAASLAPTNPSPLPQDYAAAATAINHLSANQTAMWAHMQHMLLRNVAPPTHVVNLAMAYNPTHTTTAYVPPQVQAPAQAPPIHVLTIPTSFHRGGFSQGHGGCEPGGQTWRRTGRGGQGTNPFKNVGRGAGTVVVPCGVVQPTHGPYPPMVAPSAGPTQLYSPPIKKYNNWNICYSCSFDIKDKHTSATCPIDWHRTTHCTKYSHDNAQLYIDMGHNVCTKGINKMVLPQHPLA